MTGALLTDTRVFKLYGLFGWQGKVSLASRVYCEAWLSFRGASLSTALAQKLAECPDGLGVIIAGLHPVHRLGDDSFSGLISLLGNFPALSNVTYPVRPFAGSCSACKQGDRYIIDWV